VRGYTVLSSRFLVEATTVSVVFVQQVTALLFALVLLAGSLVRSDPASLAGVSATAWASALAAGALYYGVAFWFYLAGLRGVTASAAGVFINLVPVFGITASYIVLGERLSPSQRVGAIVVIAAVARRRCTSDGEYQPRTERSASRRDGTNRYQTHSPRFSRSISPASTRIFM
jgi:probable blue pigment (indigoidine) exporter